MRRSSRMPAAGPQRGGATDAIVALFVVLAACSPGEPPTDGRRREPPRDDRRAPVVTPTDTATLVTPLRGDSLIGAARGAGGLPTVRKECIACHATVHDAPLGRRAGALAACLECHESAHEPVQAFYAGAVRGMPVPADTMFVARVACADCHTDTTLAGAGAARVAALDAMCTSCHGERFTGMLARWRQGVDWRERAVSAYVAGAGADSRLAGEPARVRVRAAREALALARTAGPLHNIRGADQLFRSALDTAAAAYRRAGVSAPRRPPLGPDPATVACVGCHYGVEAARGTVFGEAFDHAAHVVRADVACTDCHSDATYFAAGRSGKEEDREVDPRHGRTTVTAAACSDCHHATARGATACASCHQPGEIAGARAIATTMRLAPGVTRRRELPFRHAQHESVSCEGCHGASAGMAPTGATCTSCHAPHHRPDATCRSCHAGAKPVHTRQAHLGCAGCHDASKVAPLRAVRPVCESCHVDMTDHNRGRECAQCHQVIWRPAGAGKGT